jgi:Bacterial aa3 type cytochrome c oxidase subunit IV
MAEHREVEYATADGNDCPEHEKTYRMFVALVKWHIIVIGAILLLMFFFLT